MKIIFLQNCADVYGGLEFVNQSLANSFAQDGHNVEILCLWYTGNNQYISYDSKVKETVIDDNSNSKKPSKRKLVEDLKKMKFSLVYDYFRQLKKYYNCEKKSYKNFSNYLKENIYDYIIVSNPTLLKCVKKDQLHKVICHMHSGLKFYEDNKKLTQFLIKYNDKIKCFLWLTNSTAAQASKLGFKNNKYIYNPIRYNYNETKKEHKNVIYIGRISPEKRVDKLVEIFDKVSAKNPLWSFLIYGSGNLPAKTLDIIGRNNQIKLMGPTSDAKSVFAKADISVIASEYEGFSLTVLEAYECYVPVVAFDFGPNTDEVIVNSKTGFIISNGKDSEEKYIQKLEYLMHNKSKRKEMGENAKIFVKKFKIDEIKKNWYSLFEGKI